VHLAAARLAQLWVARRSASHSRSGARGRADQAYAAMTLAHIRNAVEMTTHPKLSQLLALLIEHGGLTIKAVAPLLDLPPFAALRFANHLVRLGYAMRAQDERYFATISGRGIDAVMRSDRLQ
jgi:hypothetical protein